MDQQCADTECHRKRPTIARSSYRIALVYFDDNATRTFDTAAIGKSTRSVNDTARAARRSNAFYHATKSNYSFTICDNVPK